MKRKLSNIFLAAALTSTVALTGCDDFLTPDNKSSVTDVDYFATAAGFQSLVNDTYAQLKDIYNNRNVTIYFNAGTDLYQVGRNTTDDALHRWTGFNADNGHVKDFYNMCYDAIRSAYSIQYYAATAQVGDDVKQKAIDEGRFVAALHYYLLVNNFGGVPLVTEYATTAVSGYPRATAEEVYTHIINELTEIISNGKLKASTATAGGGEASIEAAKALLAKTYLSAAWDLNKNDYFTQAAKYADEVIGGRTLTTDFAALWAADRSGDDDAEFIFDLEFDYDTQHDKNAGNWWQNMYSQYMGGSEDGMKNCGSVYLPRMHTLRCFDEGDKRYAATFMQELLIKGRWEETLSFINLGDYFGWYGNGNSSRGKLVAIYYPAYWESTPEQVAAWRAEDPENRNGAIVIPQNDKTATIVPMSTYYEDLAQSTTGIVEKYDFDDNGTHASSYSCHPCRKFDDCLTANYNAGYSFRDLHIITLPEIFLVAAEAYHKAGKDSEAMKRLNVLRKRAGVPDVTSINIDVILKESAAEMFGNGCRRMDLRRTQKLVEYNNLYNSEIKGQADTYIGQKLLWPIPQSAIDANDMLTAEDQNPGY
ncbi:MAG: RagB/SusD family nutrient uptake outer membrane protein [Bacteroides sp.]|nr:RagB/SusD family nutrient uptake outer membrane protein [Bacteroides sp.]